MDAFQGFMRDHPALAGKLYGVGMVATLTRAFPRASH